MPDLPQFQALNWHPVKQEKHLENAETHSAKDKSVGGDIIFEICLQIQGK